MAFATFNEESPGTCVKTKWDRFPTLVAFISAILPAYLFFLYFQKVEEHQYVPVIVISIFVVFHTLLCRILGLLTRKQSSYRDVVLIIVCFWVILITISLFTTSAKTPDDHFARWVGIPRPPTLQILADAGKRWPDAVFWAFQIRASEKTVTELVQKLQLSTSCTSEDLQSMQFGFGKFTEFNVPLNAVVYCGAQQRGTSSSRISLFIHPATGAKYLAVWSN